jgi:hypothetical protein
MTNSKQWLSPGHWLADHVNYLMQENQFEAVTYIVVRLTNALGSYEVRQEFSEEMEKDGYSDKKDTIEEFKKCLDIRIEELEVYRSDAMTEEIHHDKTLSPSDWLESQDESYEALFEAHKGDIEDAIISLSGF